MVQLVRSAALAAAVCAVCLVVSAEAFGHASLNRSVSPTWHVSSALLALAVLGVAALVAHLSELVLLEVAAAAVAGGLAANSLVAVACGGVADFVHAGGWIYSPGDLAVVAGTALLALGTAVAAPRVLAAEAH